MVKLGIVSNYKFKCAPSHYYKVSVDNIYDTQTKNIVFNTINYHTRVVKHRGWFKDGNPMIINVGGINATLTPCTVDGKKLATTLPTKKHTI